ncbi:MAG: hypothetical protein QM756_06030 [Polyangiaceae bacterium]
MMRRTEDVAPVVKRLIEAGRVEQNPSGQLATRDFVVPLGSSVGFEAAVFDHVQAVVQTICQRLNLAAFGSDRADVVGGSTYTFDVWPGHPLEAEVKAQLARVRRDCGELRQRVDEHNRGVERRPNYEQVITYVGQCVRERDDGNEAGENGHGKGD